MLLREYMIDLERIASNASWSRQYSHLERAREAELHIAKLWDNSLNALPDSVVEEGQEVDAIGDRPAAE